MNLLNCFHISLIKLSSVYGCHGVVLLYGAMEVLISCGESLVERRLLCDSWTGSKLSWGKQILKCFCFVRRDGYRIVCYIKYTEALVLFIFCRMFQLWRINLLIRLLHQVTSTLYHWHDVSNYRDQSSNMFSAADAFFLARVWFIGCLIILLDSNPFSTFSC